MAVSSPETGVTPFYRATIETVAAQWTLVCAIGRTTRPIVGAQGVGIRRRPMGQTS
ncbi:MAG: hypothetical protein WBA63_17975 [Thermomicrobiales bacterium]